MADHFADIKRKITCLLTYFIVCYSNLTTHSDLTQNYFNFFRFFDIYHWLPTDDWMCRETDCMANMKNYSWIKNLACFVATVIECIYTLHLNMFSFYATYVFIWIGLFVWYACYVVCVVTMHWCFLTYRLRIYLTIQLQCRPTTVYMIDCIFIQNIT